MYGSMFRMRPKAGMKDKLVETMMANQRQAPGMITAYLLQEDKDGSVWGFGVFEDEKTYRANASDPAQDEQYRKFRELLESDPEWHDGTVLERTR